MEPMKHTRHMKPKQELKFSWPGLFITTAISFALFTVFLKVIGESSVYTGLFVKIAIVSLICWPIAYAYETISRPDEKRKKHTFNR